MLAFINPLHCQAGVVGKFVSFKNADFNFDQDGDNFPDGWEEGEKIGQAKWQLEGKGGEKSFSLQTSEKGALISFLQKIKVKPNTEYLLSFYYRTKYDYDFHTYEPKDNLWGDGTVMAWGDVHQIRQSANWREFRLLKNSEERQELNLHFFLMDAINKLYIDHVRLYEVTDCVDKENINYGSELNLVPNPGLELKVFDGKRNVPLHYEPNPESSQKVIPNCYQVDDRVYHSGKQSVLLQDVEGRCILSSVSKSAIDYTKEYELSAWVKLEGAAGKSCLGMIWYAAKFDWEKEARKRPNRLHCRPEPKEIGRSYGKVLTGTSDWEKISFKVKPPYGAQFMALAVCSEDNEGKVWFDDLYCHTLGAEEIEILGSQAGYHPQGKKEVVVRTIEKYQKWKFYLLDNRNNKIVKKGDLIYWGKYLWDRPNWIADFSDYRKEGEYRLKVEFEGRESKESHPFPIKKSLYEDLAHKSIEFYWINRCGVEVPGWHKVCHTNDAWVRDEKSKVFHHDLTGGWHDAGDYSKHYGGDQTSVYALSVLHDLSSNKRYRFKGDLPDPLELARVGGRYFLKSYVGKGGMTGTVLSLRSYDKLVAGADIKELFLRDCSAPPSVGSKNKQGRFAFVSPCRHQLYGQAKFALSIKEIDKGLHDRSVMLLEKCYPYYISHGRMSLFRNEPAYLLTAIYMHELTGKSIYRQHSTELVSDMVRQVKDGYHVARKRGFFVYYSSDALLCIPAMIEYAECYPEDPLVPKIKEAVEQFMEDLIVPLSDQSPFRHMLTLDKNNPEVWPEPATCNTSSVSNTMYLGSIAQASAMAGIFLKKEQYVDIAERQIQWIVGRNPAGMSMVGDIGYREMNTFTGLHSVKDKVRKVNTIPGGVVIGLRFASSSYSSSFGGTGFAIGPAKCIYQAVASTYPVFCGESEVYQSPTARFILANIYLARTKEAFSNR